MLIHYVFPSDRKLCLNCYVDGVLQAIIKGFFDREGLLHVETKCKLKN